MTQKFVSALAYGGQPFAAICQSAFPELLSKKCQISTDAQFVPMNKIFLHIVFNCKFNIEVFQ